MKKNSFCAVQAYLSLRTFVVGDKESRNVSKDSALVKLKWCFPLKEVGKGMKERKLESHQFMFSIELEPVTYFGYKYQLVWCC